MVFVLLGANFNDIPLDQLESLERHTDAIRETLLGSRTPSAPNSSVGSEPKPAISGGVLIGTCNRFEVYLDAENFHDAVAATISAVSSVAGLEPDYVSQALQVTYGSAVAQHLYSVASGLESMIVGEAEISGQVKRSLQVAHESGQATPALQHLFQTASSVAKRVTTDTGLGAAGRSIISAAIDIHESKFDAVAGKQVLIMGTGAYARVIVAALQRAGCRNILVYSTSGRAQLFSDNHDTCAIEEDELAQALARVDLIITASGTRGYSINLKQATDALALRGVLGLPAALRIIDVALAASVAPPVYDLPNVSVLDLDYIRLHAPTEHSEAILAAREIVVGAVEEFEAEQIARSVDPMISALRAHVGVWVADEVERVRRKEGEARAEEVAKSLVRVTNALLHAPSVNAKELAKSGNHEDYARAVKTLFGIDLTAMEGGAND